MAIEIQHFMNEDFPARLAQSPDRAKAFGCKYQINITGDGGGEWFIDVSDSGPAVKSGQDNADTVISINAEDFQKLMETPGNYMQLYFSGKLKVAGNPAFGMRFADLFKI